MNRDFLRKFLALTVFLAALCLFYCSCATEDTPYEKLEMAALENSQGSEGSTRTLCYADEKQAVFTSEVRNDAATGVLYDTESIILYDLAEDRVKAQFALDDENYVRNIVPYRDGVLYASYREMDKAQDVCRWQIVYRDEEGKQILDEGVCRVFDRIPAPALIGGKPVYLFENVTAGSGATGYSCGIRQISDLKVESVFETDQFTLSGTDLVSNGREYAFMAEEEGQMRCCVGDLTGISRKFNVKGTRRSFAINDGYVAIALDESAGHAGEDAEEDSEDGSYSLLFYDIEAGQTETYRTEEMIYGLSGGPGKSFVCVDWAFTPYDVNPENGELTELALPEKADTAPSVRFFSLNETEYLAEVLAENGGAAYYRLRMK